MDEQLYTSHKKELAAGLLVQSQLHDKSILSLASGALGLSLTFVRNVAPVPVDGTLWLLGICWFFFALSIVAVLVSFQTSMAAYQRAESLADTAFEEGRAVRVDEENPYTTWTKWLNYLGVVFFASGILMWSWFAMANLSERVIENA